MNQKDAVYEAIRQLKPGEVESAEKVGKPVTLTKQEKEVVQQKLFDGFRKGKIQYNQDMPSDDKLEMYIKGLVSNWLRKDGRLNGGVRYQPRRPGSRTGVAPTVQPTVQVDPSQLEAIQALAGEGEEVQVFVVRRQVARPNEQHNENGAATAPTAADPRQ